MAELINNVLDFARGRMGGGLTLERDATQPLQPVLAHVVAELQTAHPERVFDVEFAITQPVHCDRHRIGQLFSNLLGNAVAHGAKDAPVRAAAHTTGEVFELWVANDGEPIAPEAIKRLFEPFVRGEGPSNRQGLGLGLYICSQIAQAHGGRVTVDSSPQETRFTFRMPLA